MAALIAKIVFWSLTAVVIACLEIESEGKYGWAEHMPTWYRTTGFWARAYGKIMGGKPLTGYHTFMFSFIALIFHAHFFMGTSWTVTRELQTCALFLAWCPLWDYYWFVLNPHYHRKFKKNRVWWHSQSIWVLGLFPVDYAIGVGISLGVAQTAAYVDGSQRMFVEHLELLGGFALATILLHLTSPLYRRWYAHMRRDGERYDARYKTTIFHDNRPYNRW